MSSLLLTGSHTAPVVTWWCTTNATNLRERFLLSSVFYLKLLPAFLGLPWGRQFSLKSSRLHDDLRNIAPARIFAWFTAIHKRVLHGKFYLRVRVSPELQILQHNTSHWFWTCILIDPYVTSCLFQPLRYIVQVLPQCPYGTLIIRDQSSII